VLRNAGLSRDQAINDSGNGAFNKIFEFHDLPLRV
jgi:hypothetical protein